MNSLYDVYYVECRLKAIFKGKNVTINTAVIAAHTNKLKRLLKKIDSDTQYALLIRYVYHNNIVTPVDADMIAHFNECMDRINTLLKYI